MTRTFWLRTALYSLLLGLLCSAFANEKQKPYFHIDQSWSNIDLSSRIQECFPITINVGIKNDTGVSIDGGATTYRYQVAAGTVASYKARYLEVDAEVMIDRKIGFVDPPLQTKGISNANEPNPDRLASRSVTLHQIYENICDDLVEIMIDSVPQINSRQYRNKICGHHVAMPMVNIRQEDLPDGFFPTIAPDEPLGTPSGNLKADAQACDIPGESVWIFDIDFGLQNLDEDQWNDLSPEEKWQRVLEHPEAFTLTIP